MESLQEFMKALNVAGNAGQPDKNKAADNILRAIANLGKVSETMIGGGGGLIRPSLPSPMPMGVPPARMPTPIPSMPPPGAGPTSPMIPPGPPGMTGPQGLGMMQKIGTSPMAMAYLKSLVPGLGAGEGIMPGM